MKFLLLISFAVIAISSLGVDCEFQPIKFWKCSYIQKGNNECTVNQVSIDPCPEAKQNLTCVVSRGSNYSIQIDYTPKFNGTNIKAKFYENSFLIDIPMPGMKENACQFTKCPLAVDEKHTYKYIEHLPMYYPPARYNAKWRLWNEDNKECCATYPVLLV